jgi:predicted negative regulator of RcsB-dependent stress response
MGDVYSKKGLKDKARTEWEKSLDLDPKQEKVKNKLKSLGVNKRNVR